MQRRTERFGLILTPAERTAVLKMAEHDGGLSSAALLRRLIRAEALRRGLWSVTDRVSREGVGRG